MTSRMLGLSRQLINSNITRQIRKNTTEPKITTKNTFTENLTTVYGCGALATMLFGACSLTNEKYDEYNKKSNDNFFNFGIAAMYGICGSLSYLPTAILWPVAVPYVYIKNNKE